MTEIDQDFTIYSGNDATLEIAITDSDNNDLPLSLSQATIVWVLYDDNTGIVLVTKTSADNTQIAVTNVSGGLIEVYLKEADTENLVPTIFYGHQVSVTDTNGYESTVLEGKVIVERSYD